MSKFPYIAMGIAFAATISSSTCAADPLDFEQALRLARDRSRQLVAQDTAAQAAREMAVAAAQLPDPTLRLGINNLPIDGPDRFSVARDFMTMRSIGVAQEFTGADKRRARAARFEREVDGARAMRDLTLANLQRDTALAWLERYYQEAMRGLLERQRDEARLQIDAAEAAYRGNRGSQSDAIAARSAVALMDDRIAQIDRQIATAKTLLARWVGGAADRPMGARPTTDDVRLTEAELDTQLTHHPEIAVMATREEVATAEAQIARADRRADWGVEFMFSQRGSSFSNMVSLNLSIPLQWDQPNRQDRTLAAKLAQTEQLRAEREEATRAHVAEARVLLQTRRSNRERLTHYDDRLIPLAEERTRAALTGYRTGASTLTAVLDARRMEIEIRIDRLRLELETARLWAQLNYLVPIEHAASPVAAAR
ncbi:MAG: TolC family protein [Burkholderiales bacterium]